jgi:hypothetical protein
MKLEYNSTISIMVYYVGAALLDVTVVPLIFVGCWNNVIPQTFDFVHKIDYRAALLIRLTLTGFYDIFERGARRQDNNMRFEYYLNGICESINSIKQKSIKNELPENDIV